MSLSNLNLLQRLEEDDFQDQIVEIEFSCDKKLKKAIGKLEFIGEKCPNYIELTGNIIVKVSCSKSSVELEFPDKVLIPIENICSVGVIGPPRPFECTCRATFGGTFRESAQSQRGITVRGQVCNPCFIPGTDTVLYTNDLSTNDQSGDEIRLFLPAGAPQGGEITEVNCEDNFSKVIIKGTAPVTVAGGSSVLRDFELILEEPKKLRQITIYNSNNGSFSGGIVHQSGPVLLQGQGVKVRPCQGN